MRGPIVSPFILSVGVIAILSCASQPAQVHLLTHDWKGDSNFKAKLVLLEQVDSYVLRIDMTSRLEPCVTNRKDGSLNMDAELTLKDGTVLKGKSERIVPENSSLGVYHSTVEVTFSRTTSTSQAREIYLEVAQSRCWYSMKNHVPSVESPR